MFEAFYFSRSLFLIEESIGHSPDKYDLVYSFTFFAHIIYPYVLCMICNKFRLVSVYSVMVFYWQDVFQTTQERTTKTKILLEYWNIVV